MVKMNILLPIVFIALAVSGIQGYTHQDANDYIDSVLRGRFVEEAQYRRLDPYRLPDIGPISLSVWTIRNNAHLSNGSLSHLSKVRRSADCTTPRWISANVSFSCFLQFDHLFIKYRAEANHSEATMVFYPKASIRGTNVTVHVTAAVEENVPNMRSLIINKIGDMTVTVQMINVGDFPEKVGPPVREALVQNSTTYLHRVINGEFREALAFSIYKTPLTFTRYY